MGQGLQDFYAKESRFTRHHHQIGSRSEETFKLVNYMSNIAHKYFYLFNCNIWLKSLRNIVCPLTLMRRCSCRAPSLCSLIAARRLAGRLLLLCSYPLLSLLFAINCFVAVLLTAIKLLTFCSQCAVHNNHYYINYILLHFVPTQTLLFFFLQWIR